MEQWFALAPASVQAGVLAGFAALITAIATLMVAVQRVFIDQRIARLRADIDNGIADRRAAADEKLARLRGDIERDLYQQKIELEQAQANKKYFFEKRLDLCFEAVDTAGRLASERDPIKWEEARLKSWRLYWGPLSIVEDRSVEANMVALGQIVPQDSVALPKLPMTSLQPLAYGLAHAARKLVLVSWGIQMPQPLYDRLPPELKQ